MNRRNIAQMTRTQGRGDIETVLDSAQNHERHQGIDAFGEAAVDAVLLEGHDGGFLETAKRTRHGSVVICEGD